MKGNFVAIKVNVVIFDNKVEIESKMSIYR